MTTNQVDISIQALKLGDEYRNEELIVRSEDSTSSASQQSRQYKLCS